MQSAGPSDPFWGACFLLPFAKTRKKTLSQLSVSSALALPLSPDLSDYCFFSLSYPIPDNCFNRLDVVVVDVAKGHNLEEEENWTAAVQG